MTEETEIIVEFEDRKHFLNSLKDNPGWIILKFTATWCRPCKKIKSVVEENFARAPQHVVCCDLDVDDNIDLYAFMKTMKQVKGIPALLAYKKGNYTYAPDISCSGTERSVVQSFFDSVYKN